MRSLGNNHSPVFIHNDSRNRRNPEISVDPEIDFILANIKIKPPKYDGKEDIYEFFETVKSTNGNFPLSPLSCG